MVAESLRILILEDNPADAELVQFELQEAGIIFTSKLVITEKEYVQAIQDYCPDLILSDYDLPKYNGALALAEARKRCPDTPFILVTGAVTEDRAIDILTQGAKDYVLKNRLQQRLVPAVKRALAEAEELRARKQAEEELRKAHRTLEERVKARTADLEEQMEARKKTDEALRKITERFEIAQRAAKVGTWDWNVVTGHIEWSAQMFDLLGLDPLRDTSSFEAWKTILHPDDIEVASFRIDKALKQRTMLDSDYRVVLPDGQIRWINALGEGQYDDQGQPIRMIGIILDITDRKRVGEALRLSEEKFATCFAVNPAAIAMTRLEDGLIIEVNETWQAMFGYSRDEVIGRSTISLQIWPTPEDRASLAEILKEKGSFHDLEQMLLRRSGKPFMSLASAEILTIAGEKLVLSTWLDITERKRAEEALRKSEEHLSISMDVGNAGTWEWNLQNDDVCFDYRFQTMLGYTPGELPTTIKEWLPYHHPEDVPVWMSKAKAYLQGESPIYESEHRIRNKSGNWDWVFTRGKLVDPAGHSERFVGIAMNVTKRKQSEEWLRESEERFFKTYHLSPVAMAIQNLANRTFVDVNESFLKLFGYTREEVIGHTSAELNMYGDINERASVMPVFNQGGIKNYEMTLRNKTGVIVNILVSTEKIILQGHDHIISTLIDITERKRNDETIQIMLKRFHSLVSNIHSGILLVGECGIELANQAFCDYFGLQEPPQDLIGITAGQMLEKIKNAYLHPEEEVSRIKKIIDLGQPVMGEEIAMQGGKTCLRDFIPISINGKLYGRLWNHTDITRRKQAEEAQRESERDFVAMFEQASVGKSWSDPATNRMLRVNKAFADMLGYSIDELCRMTFVEITYPEDRERDIAGYDLVRKGRAEKWHTEKRYIRKDGSLMWADVSGSMVHYEDGRPDRSIAVIQDITMRKRAEEELQRSEARWNAAIESFAEGAIIATEDEQVIYWNPAAREMHGFTRPDEGIEPLEKTPVTFQLWTPDDSHMLELDEWPMRRIKRGESVRDLELRIRRPDRGWEKVFSYSGSMVETTGGERLIFLTCRDLTEQRKAEVARRLSERRLIEVLESMPDAFVSFDSDMRYTYVNANAERLQGARREELIGKDVRDVYPDVESYRTISQYERVIREQKPVTLTSYHAGFDRWVEVRAFPTPEGVSVFYKDVSAELKAEKALRESEERLRLVGDNLPDSAVYQYAHEPDGSVRFLYVSQGIERLNGVKVEDVLRDPQTLHGQIPPEYLERLAGSEKKSAADLSDFDMEVPMRRADGEVRWMRLHSRPRRTPDGRTVWDGVQIDVTERKHAEEELHESHNRFMVLTQSINAGVALVDEQGRFAIVNPAFLRLFDLPAEADIRNVNDRDWSQWQVFAEGGELLDVDEHPVRKAALTGRAVRNRLVAVKSPGSDSLKWMLVSAEPILKADGRMDVMICTYQDITEQKHAEVALKQDAEKLEATNKELESFSYSVSHDLRAPLRAISGYSQMILRKQTKQCDEETRHRLRMIDENAEKMGRLIDDLLAFSRMGTQPLNKESVNMEGLIGDVWDELLAIHPDRTIELKYSQMPAAWGDRALIRQIYSNLLGNAVKFTRGKDVAVIEAGSFIRDGETVYYVRDNGIGFDMKFYAKLFGVFQRLHSDEEYEGTGVGLAIVQRIIHRHGGRTWAEGEVDKGATFYFTLPTGQE